MMMSIMAMHRRMMMALWYGIAMGCYEQQHDRSILQQIWIFIFRRVDRCVYLSSVGNRMNELLLFFFFLILYLFFVSRVPILNVW